MNSITIKKIVCLESDEEISRVREEQQRHSRSGSSSLVRDHLWREIVVSATPERIQVNLGNVDEEGAKRGFANVRQGCRTYNLTWTDLADRDGLENLLRFEVMVAGRKVLEILEQLREMSTEAQDMLAI
jgi:hypothetical protein